MRRPRAGDRAGDFFGPALRAQGPRALREDTRLTIAEACRPGRRSIVSTVSGDRSRGLQGSEAELADAVAEFHADPLGYVILAFDWGGGDLIGHDGPDAWQADILESIGSGSLSPAEALRVAVASGHGVGKSALVAWIVLWAMSTRPHLAGVVTANTKTQLETKTWRELAVWHKRAINAHWFKWTASKFYQVDHPETWFVAAIPWTKERPEAFAGLHSEHVLVVYDEASAVDDSIWEVSEGAMTTPGAIWCAFGNPTRNSGRFKECFGRFRHRWQTRQIDSRGAKMANRAQLEQWIEDYGEDSDFARIRVRGVFPCAGGNQFIPGDLVDGARNREAIGNGPIVLGVDVARFGDDQTVLLSRQGDKVKMIARYRGLDTMQTAGKVSEAMDKYEPAAVFIDGVGVGGGVVDRLRQLGYRVTDINAGARATDAHKYYNLRAEMWGKLRDWLGKGCLPDDQELADDLMAPEYGFDGRNRIQLEKKERMKERGLASPDCGDALALTFAAPVREKKHKLQFDNRGIV